MTMVRSLILAQCSTLVAFVIAIGTDAATFNPDQKCFSEIVTMNIPENHVFHRIRKPAVVGHKGNIQNFQENSLEGLNSLIDKKIAGMHMQVQVTKDKRLIVFGDDNMMRMTGENFLVAKLPFYEIEKMKLQKTISYGPNTTYRYSSYRKIRSLEDVLNAVKNKGLLIYIEMMPANVPPLNPLDRHKSMETGTAVGKLIRRLNLENEVFVVSRDPFKLVAAKYQNSKLIVGWWVGTDLYGDYSSNRARKEFVDLPKLTDCYRMIAPIQGPKFIEFALETGIITKSVNGSFVDLDFDIYDNSRYFSGRTEKTTAMVTQNYNPLITFGTLMIFNQGSGPRDQEADEQKLSKLRVSGVSRIITDNIYEINKLLLRSTSGACAVTSLKWVAISCCFFMYYLTLEL